jgi:hypothetical protein
VRIGLATVAVVVLMLFGFVVAAIDRQPLGSVDPSEMTPTGTTASLFGFHSLGLPRVAEWTIGD